MPKQDTVESPSVRSHRRQFVWLILVPFLILAGIVITGAVLVSTGGDSLIGVWTDVSLIALIAPALILVLVFLAVMIATIYGMAKILQGLPVYSGKSQGIFRMISAWTRRLANGTAKPFIWLQQADAVLKALFRQ